MPYAFLKESGFPQSCCTECFFQSILHFGWVKVLYIRDLDVLAVTRTDISSDNGNSAE